MVPVGRQISIAQMETPGNVLSRDLGDQITLCVCWLQVRGKLLRIVTEGDLLSILICNWHRLIHLIHLICGFKFIDLNSAHFRLSRKNNKCITSSLIHPIEIS
jgi:hypothetical protein